MSERPSVTRPAGSIAYPHCGKCGVEYQRTGYDRAAGTDTYAPRCNCWRAPSAPAQTPEWIAEYRKRLDAVLDEMAGTAASAIVRGDLLLKHIARLDAWVLGTGKEGET